jgi:hypothetical protein
MCSSYLTAQNPATILMLGLLVAAVVAMPAVQHRLASSVEFWSNREAPGYNGWLTLSHRLLTRWAIF